MDTFTIDKDGKVGILLTFEVPVSPRKHMYNSEIVSVPIKWLCCKCDCKAADLSDQNMLCVHILVSLYLA